ncbi:MAG TPA: serine/threonine-protein kinase [Woeseiaceae bacterium]|nr:serine/threonine-protein kinase [Woeseiaceae bacterium]
MAEKGRGLHWEQVERLFHAALEKRPHERAAFLDEACHENPALRQELEAMLTADADADGVLDHPLPIDEYTNESPPLFLASGEQVGPWRILSELGRGGMGVVYLAERADGTYEQQVALKVIIGGVLGVDMGPRFDRERRILGRLQHPNIARLIDAGTSAGGAPFLVMELVRGVPVTTWSTSNNLNIKERLQLILQVCDALQHAHRNLVVHRDLKPGNILVAGDGAVRLLDFGVARLMAGPDDDDMMLTRGAYVPLTPQYAAPEQMSDNVITTATDIFSLGAVLCELLSDQPPRGKAAASPVAMLQMMERAIAPPSSHRELPSAWRRQLQGDLDAIVQKATAPDPARRYGSVSDFAEDIRRYLAHEPVLARPESLAYRAAKFVRRHQAGVAAMTAMVIAIGVGIATTAWQAREAQTQAHKAEAVKEFVLSLFGGADPAEALGEELTARQLVDGGADRIQTELADEPGVRAEILTFLADMYDKMDQDDRAIELVNEALLSITTKDSMEYAKALLVQGRILIGKSDDVDGTESLDLALPILRAHGAELDQAEALDLKSIVANRQGDIDASLNLAEQALALRLAQLGEDHEEVAMSYNNLGVVMRTKGNYAESRQYHEKALDIRRRVLPELHPKTGLSLNNLGALEYGEGNFAHAAEYFSESLALNRQVNGSAHQDTIAALNNFGIMQLRLGKLGEARETLTEVYDYWVAQDKSEHPNALITRINIATVRRAAGDIEWALAEYQDLEKKLVSILGAEHPFVAATLHHQARCYLELGRIDEAGELLARTLAIRDKALGPDHPDSGELIRDQGMIALLRNDLESARSLTERAIEMQRSKLPAAHPAISSSDILLGQIALAEGHTEAALTLQRNALANFAAILPPENLERAQAHFEFARTLTVAGAADDAVLQFLAARSAMAAQFGESSWKVARVDYWLAAALKLQGKQDEAANLRLSAKTTISEQLPEYHPVRRETLVEHAT